MGSHRVGYDWSDLAAAAAATWEAHSKCSVPESSPNHPRYPSLWKNCLLPKCSPVPKKLGTAALQDGSLNPLQCSCLENPMDPGPWWATVHEVAKSQTWLSTPDREGISGRRNSMGQGAEVWNNMCGLRQGSIKFTKGECLEGRLEK